jgi:diguanylate cyclase (GGDEF)-like protein
VGTHIACIIRESDIVARIEDDRIIAVLPRAGIRDGCRVAQEVCHSVERRAELLPELSGLTVSVGIAEFPSCADSVFALLDAADFALSEAKSQGRNRAVAAEALGTSAPSQIAFLAG